MYQHDYRYLNLQKLLFLHYLHIYIIYIYKSRYHRKTVHMQYASQPTNIKPIHSLVDEMSRCWRWKLIGPLSKPWLFCTCQQGPHTCWQGRNSRRACRKWSSQTVRCMNFNHLLYACPLVALFNHCWVLLDLKFGNYKSIWIKFLTSYWAHVHTQHWCQVRAHRLVYHIDSFTEVQVSIVIIVYCHITVLYGTRTTLIKQY